MQKAEARLGSTGGRMPRCVVGFLIGMAVLRYRNAIGCVTRAELATGSASLHVILRSTPNLDW